MGNSTSTPTDESKEPKVEIKVLKKDELPKLDLTNLGSMKMPEKPKIKSKYDIKKEAEAKKGKIAFDIKEQFDLSTYQGRFWNQVNRNNPLLFFQTTKQIEAAQDAMLKLELREEAARNIGSEHFMTKDEIEEVKRNNAIVGSAVHPDTNQITPFYLRLSGFVWFNAPQVFMVLFVRQQSPLFGASLQFWNQTYNAGMNYGNRNASSNYTNQDLARGYGAAVIVGCSMAFGVRTVFAKQLSKLSGPRLVFANFLVAYLSAAPAGAANAILMRYKELENGIVVQNKKGDVEYGQSKEAGKKAVLETAISRCVLPTPVLLFPALGSGLLSVLRLMPKNQSASKIIEFTIVLGSLTFALPMSVALFEQRASIPREQMDEAFQNMKPNINDEENKDKEFVDTFYFNKGL